ncbi:nitrogen regulation protein NR(II) [Thermodesulfobacteriota bacterium]
MGKSYKRKKELIEELVELREKVARMERLMPESRQVQGEPKDNPNIELAREEDWYKELFNNVTDGVLVHDMDEKFVEANEMASKQTGYSKEELLRITIRDIIEPGLMPDFKKLMRNLKDKRHNSIELELISKNGRHTPVAVNCRIISYDGKEMVLCVVRDQTKTRLMQNQLIRSAGLAATGQLAATIAHEIYSPLQAITMMLNMIAKKHKENKELLGDIELLKGSYNSIQYTVKNMLDLSRPGKSKKRVTDVNRLIEETVDLASGHLKKNRVRIAINLSPRVPRINISAQQMSQVFLNLINNSIEAITGRSEPRDRWMKRASTGGEILIRTNLRKGNIIIRIADSGPGISEDDLNRIFDPFYTKKKRTEMGIGLPVCYSIIQDHKGSINAKNSAEGGAVFTISLPVS